MEVLFSQFATTRRDEFQLQTKIIELDGKLFARKEPMSYRGIPHIKNIYENSDKLRQALKTEVHVCNSFLNVDYLDFEYLQGKNYFELLLDALQENGLKKLIAVFDEYNNFLNNCYQEYKPFEFSKEIKMIFGVSDLKEQKCFYPANIDLLPANIIMTKDGPAIIDYEWVYDITLPVDFVLYRAIRSFGYTVGLENETYLDALYEHFNFDANKLYCYDLMENHFANYAHDAYGMAGVFERYRKKAYPWDELTEVYDMLAHYQNCMQQLEEERKITLEHSKTIHEYEFQIQNYINEVESWRQQYDKLRNMPIKGHMKQIVKRIVGKK